jgi:hypothetical protein
MRRWVPTLAVIALCSSALRADVTVTSTVTIEGSAPGMAGGGMTPRMTMRIKGLRARSDVDVNGQMQTSITDLTTKQITVLQHAQRTAQIYGPGALPLPAQPGPPPKVEASSKPTGRSRPINGVPCDEYAIKMTMSMADFTASASMPPQAAEMMKDVLMVISGSVWVAKSGPGASDFAAFQRAAADSNMAAAFGGVVPGMQSGGIDRVLKAISAMPGLPHLTELQMNVEGTGQMVEAMRKMGTMKVRNAVTAVSTEAIPDDQFQVPADYKVVRP